MGLNLKGYKSLNCFVLSFFFFHFYTACYNFFDERVEKKLVLFHNVSETSKNKVNL